MSAEPIDRGIEVPAPDLGRCFDGTTEFGFQPCEVVATAPPPVPPVTTLPSYLPMDTLPATGLPEVLIVAAVLLLILGLGLWGFPRR